MTIKAIYSLLIGKKQRRNLDLENIKKTAEVLAPTLRDIYLEKLLPQLQCFENDRIDTLNKIRRRSLYCIPLAFSLIMTSLYLMPPFQGMFISVIFFILFIGISTWPKVNYQDRISSAVLKVLFKNLGFNYETVVEGSINNYKNILPSYSSSTTTHNISGNHKGVTFNFFTGHLKKKREKKTVTVFKGFFISFEFPKNFVNKTVIIRHDTIHSTPRGLSKVKLEDPEFNKQYVVYSDDQIEARYLITVSFMVRFLKLRQFYKQRVNAVFYNNKLMFMINTNRYHNFSLELSPFESYSLINEFSKLDKDLNFILAIIDILKLDQKTGL